MNRKISLIILVVIAVAFLIFAAPPSQPEVSYPSTTGIRINAGTEINWTNSSDSDNDAIKYNLFYSNNSGLSWYPIIFDWGYENKLNDSSQSKNLSFSGNQNKTIYINIPKVANITKARLNLTGYFTVSNIIYNATKDEADSDGGLNQVSTGFSLGHRSGKGFIELYLLINTPPNANITAIGHKTFLGGAPQTLNIIYDVKIAEATGYLVGDPSNDNTSAYVTVRDNFNVSTWGSDATYGALRNITFDTPYEMSSAKKYIIWYNFVSGNTGAGDNIYSLLEDTDPANNLLGWIEDASKLSFPSILDTLLYIDNPVVSTNWLEVGNPDGIYEFSQTGQFTIENTTEDFKSVLQNYMNINCTSINLWENCTIPLTVHSNITGRIEISGIDIQFTDYWWNTSNMKELTTYKINITSTDGNSNGSSSISANDFIISHNPPNATLNSPSNSYSNSSSDPANVWFNCSANDDWGLANISLYITDKNNQSFSLNKAGNVSGTNNEKNWTLSLNNGDYTWNCLVSDVVGNYNWAENRSIKINYVAPIAPSSLISGSGGGGTISKILFDVKILKFDSPAIIPELFNFTYFVKGTGTINQDVIIKFWLEKGGEILSSGFDTIYFGTNEEKTENVRLSLPSTASEGIYDFYVKAFYEQYSAEANRKIEIISPEIKENIISINSCSEFNFLYFLKKIWYYILIGFGLLLIFFLLLIFILKRKKKELHNLRNIKGTKIISEEGIYIGDVENVHLNGKNIDGWLIKPRKTISKKIKDKKILIKNKDVKEIGEIMIVDKKVSDFFK